MAAPAPVTSGSPEFDALLKKWDDLRDQMLQAQVDYKLAKPEGRAAIQDKFKQLHGDGEKLQPELLKAAEAGLAKDPKGVAFTTFLASFANGLYLQDRYEESLRLAEKLIDAKFDNKRIYNLAGKCAFNLCDFDKAEKYLKTAQEGSALDGRADGYLQNIAAYKTLDLNDRNKDLHVTINGADRVLPRTRPIPWSVEPTEKLKPVPVFIEWPDHYHKNAVVVLSDGTAVRRVLILWGLWLGGGRGGGVIKKMNHRINVCWTDFGIRTFLKAIPKDR